MNSNTDRSPGISPGRGNQRRNTTSPPSITQGDATPERTLASIRRTGGKLIKSIDKIMQELQRSYDDGSSVYDLFLFYEKYLTPKAKYFHGKFLQVLLRIYLYTLRRLYRHTVSVVEHLKSMRADVTHIDIAEYMRTYGLMQLRYDELLTLSLIKGQYVNWLDETDEFFNDTLDLEYYRLCMVAGSESSEEEMTTAIQSLPYNDEMFEKVAKLFLDGDDTIGPRHVPSQYSFKNNAFLVPFLKWNIKQL